MQPTLNRLRRRGAGVALVASLGLVAPSVAVAGEPLIDPAALQATQAWNSPLWKGVHGPTDPYVIAAFEDELARLDDAEALAEAGGGELPAHDHDHDHAAVDEATAAAPAGEAPAAAEEAAPAAPAAWPHSVSIGLPNRGWLAYAEQLPAGDYFTVREKTNYGTREMIEAITAAGAAVHAEFPETKRLHVGNLSWPRGGKLFRHLSHQSGRDADIGYYMKSGHDEGHFKRATARTLDVPRSWVFIESLVADDKVEYVFSDRRLMRKLKAHARDVAKVSPERLAELFGSGKKAGIIRHLRGHADHIHVRFRSPQSVAAVKKYIEVHGLKAIKPLPVYARIKRGDSLWKLARRHRTSIKKLTRWNRMSRKKILRPGKKLIVGWKRPSLPELGGGS